LENTCKIMCVFEYKNTKHWRNIEALVNILKIG